MGDDGLDPSLMVDLTLSCLLIVQDRLNQSKGAKPPSEWMSPNQLFRCEYLGLWVRVLEKYKDLRMSANERRIFDRQLNAC